MDGPGAEIGAEAGARELRQEWKMQLDGSEARATK